jgi:hypothetical protein
LNDASTHWLAFLLVFATSRARNLRYLREQLKKHGLLPEEDEATTRGTAPCRRPRGESIRVLGSLTWSPPFSFPTEALASVESGGQASAAAESIDIDEIADKIDDNEESVLLLFDDDAQKKPAAATSTAAAVPEQKGTEDEIANLLNAVLPPTENDQSHAALLDALMPAGQPQEQPQPASGATASQPTATTAADAEQELAEWRAKVDKFQDDLKKRIRDGATEETIEEDVINFITAEGGGVQDEDEEDEVDWESRLQDIPGLDQDNESGFKGECHYLFQSFLFSEYVLCCSRITHHTHTHTHTTPQ